MREARRIEVRLLGPIEAAVDGRRVALGGDRQRALLALLALAPGTVTTRERLIDELWGQEPPANADHSLQMQVSRLRKALSDAGAPEDRLLTRGRGYLLRLEPGERDLDAWEEALARVRQARADGDEAGARRRVLEALGLWRGEPLGDTGAGTALAAERTRLSDQRLGAVLERIDADLALGADAELIGELEALVAANPFQERLRAQLMLALYRAGRQADALSAYRDTRRLLVEQLGIEPGPVLQDLEARILRQEASLTPGPRFAPDANQGVSRQRRSVPSSAPPAPVGTACPGCGAAGVPGARFCSSCGAALVPLPSAEERKLVSVVVCSLAGPASSSDPEDHRAAIEPHRAAAEAAIERFGGTVERFIGDAVVGVFGAPRAREDDAERAVNAALHVVEGPAGASARVAVDTGEALVSLRDQPVAGRPVAAGEVLARCLRLSQAAPPGIVVVGERTRAATASDFEYEPVAGDGQAGKAFRAVAALGSLGDYLSSAPAPLVGREDELDLLCRIHARASRELSPQLVTIVGEPGVGKSRLLAELRPRLEAGPNPMTWGQGRCLPYGEGVTFWALGEVVKAQAGILESDGTADVRGKLGALTEPLVRDRAEREWLEARLAPLVGVDAARALGSVERDEAFTAWRRFLEALAARRPLTLAFEDVHWADAAFLDFVEHLIEWASGASIFITCTARPEFLERRRGWGAGARNSTTISLSPLSDEETAQLVHALLDRRVLDAGVQRALLGRAGGNPLYAVEFVRMIAHGSPDPDAVPDSIQAVIAARLDTLELEDKALIQDAAVVGKVFWAGAVASLAGAETADVQRRLHGLVRRDFLRPARISSARDEAEYSFAHILIRDVAYGQIPRAARLAKHRAAAAWLERLAGERVSTYAEVLADHYSRALDLAAIEGEGVADPELADAARRFLVLAGDRASSLNPAQAEAFYERALALVEPDDPERGVVLAHLAHAAFRASSFAAGEQRYVEALVELRRHGRVREAGEAMVQLAYVARGRGETARAAELAASAVELLERQPPGPELARAFGQVAVERFFAGQSAACVEWADRAIALADRLAAPELRVRPLQLRGMARCELADLDGLDDLREALRLGLDLGLGLEAAQSYGNLAIWVWRTEGPATALELNHAAVELCERQGILSWVAWVKAESVWMLFDLGRHDEILSVLAEAEERARRGGARYPLATARPYAIAVEAVRGHHVRACELADAFLPEARAIGDVLVLVPALAAAADAAWRREDGAAALALAEELLRETEGRPAYRGDHLIPLAEIFCGAGHAQRAAGLLAGAEPPALRHRLARLSARAIVAQATGDAAAARAGFTLAAEGWSEFGHALEADRALSACRTLSGPWRASAP